MGYLVIRGMGPFQLERMGKVNHSITYNLPAENASRGTGNEVMDDISNVEAQFLTTKNCFQAMFMNFCKM